MSKNRTKADIQLELTQAQKRIAELETAVARESEDRFASVFRVSPAQMALTDAASGKYVEVNAAFLQTLGFAREEVIGRTALELSLFHNPAQRTELLQRMSVQGYLHNEQVLVQAKTGEVRHGIFSAEYVHVGSQKLLLTVMNDVTEKMQAEQRWQFALEGAGYGVWDWDVQTNRVFFSRQWKSMLGYEEREIGDSLEEWSGRVHPDDLAAAMEKVNAHLEGRLPAYASEHRIRCKDGSYKWILDSGRVVEWTEDHKPLRVIGTHMDISERKAAEENLRASEEHYRTLVKSLDVSLCRWLPDTTLTYANEKYKKIFGVRGDAVGQKWLDFLPEETRDATVAFYENVTKDPRSVTYEHPVHVEDGSVRHYHWTDTPILDERGHVLEFQSVGLDITERKNAENAVRENEARLKGFLDATPDAMAIVNTQGNIILVNAQTESMFGYSQSELAGAAVETLMPGSLHAQHVENRANFMSQPHKLPDGSARDMLALRKNGEEFPVEISLSHHKMVTGEAVVLCAIRDVTERRRTQELITAQRDLARLISVGNSDEFPCAFCLQVALRVSKMDSGGVYLFDEQSRAFELVHHQGLGAEFAKAVGQLGEDAPSAKMILSGTTAYLTEADLSGKEYPRVEGLRSLAVIPIQHHGQVLGCMNIASHILPDIPDWSRSALETLAVEIGNVLIHRRTEESLKASRAQLSQALVAARMGSWRYHIPTARVEWSPEAAILFGIDASHDDFSAMLTRFHPDDRERVLDNIHEALAQKKVLDREYRMFDAEGNIRWVINYGHVECDADGNPLTVVGLVQDITQRKEMENALEAETVRRRILFEESPDGILVIDPQTAGFVEFNTTAHTQLGYTRAEFAKLHIFDVEVQESANETLAHIGEVVRNGRADFETLQRTKQGEIRNIHVTAQVVEILGEQVYYCTWHDVTERKRTEEARRQSHDLLATTEELARVGGWEWNVGQRTMTWTEETYRIHGMQPGEPAAGSPKHIDISLACYDPSDRTVINTAFLRCIEEGVSYDMEFPITRVDGQRIWIRTRADAVKDGERVIRVVGNIQDITERKQAEQALHFNEVKWRSLFESCPVGIALGNVQGEFLDANPAYLAQLGYTRDEMAKIHYRDYTPPEWHEQEAKNVAQLKASGVPIYFEKEHIRKDGTVFPVALTGWVIRDESGSPDILGVFVQDISERKHAEESLRESESRYRLLVETSVEGIWSMDREHRTNYVNHSMADMLGYEAAEMLGRKVEEFFFPEDMEFHQVRMEKRHSGQDEVYERRLRRRDGSQLWTLVSARVQKDSLGNFNGSFAMFTDITERKLAEEKLADTERRYRALIENAPDGIVLISSDGRFKYASPSVTRIFGYGQEEIPQQSPVEMTHPEELPLVLAELTALIEDPGRISTLQYRFRHKNGGWRWIESTFSNLLSTPNVEAIIINFRDIHERKLAEEELMKSQALLTEAQRIGRIGHMEWNGRGAHMTCSDELYDILGLPRDTVVNQEVISRLMLPGERDRLLQLDRQAIQQRQDMNYEYRIRLKDGSERWLHQMGKVTYNENGAPIRMMAIVQDVTERKQAEETLRENRTRIEMALKGADAGMWDWNVKTGETVFNERWAEMAGYTLKELEPLSIQTWVNLCHPDDLKVSEMLLQRHFTGETEYYECEARMQHKNGSWVWVIDRGKVMEWDADGNPVRMFGTHLDVTERKQTELALRASEEKYRGLMESLDNAISTTAYDGTILYLNDTAAENLGGTPQELIGKKIHELFPEPFASRQLAAVQDVFQTNREAVYETPSMVKSGLRWFRVAFQPLHDETGQVTQVLVNVTDIHDLKATQQELLELNRTLEEKIAQRTAEVQDLYENAPTGYHSLDADGYYVLVNQTELNWLGYSREEVIGHNAGDFLTEQSRDIFRQFLPIFRQQGWIKDLELEFICKDGSILPVALSATAIYDEAGNFVMSRSTLFDITERKRAERALRESEEQNRLLFEVSPVPIALLGEAGQIVRANHAYEQLTGIPWSGLYGKTSVELGLVDAQVINDLTHAMIDAISKRENFTVMGHSLTSSDGTKRFVESRVFLLPINSINHILVTSNDISTYKKAEEALQLANRELERSLRLKDEFLANMSHELRTPLNAILGISESLSEQVIGPLNDKQQKYIQTVLESGQHLLSLINDILDLAKINAGKIEMEMAEAELAVVAESSLRMVRELAQKKGQSLNLKMDPALTRAWVDERRLKQMIVNLLSNAVKFTPQGGSIGLEVRGDRQHDTLQFIVWDTGIGIHADDLPRLFRPFAQLDASLTRGAQGTGLGLVLVSQMARLHGGGVSVESEPGRGSRFTISIPWVLDGVTTPLRTGALPADNHVPTPSEKTRPKIVLVEDTEVVTMLISDYLTHHGYQVYAAGNGLEGLALVQQVRPDVILMDIMMPEMDGLETTRQIRARPGFEHTPIIALTALAMYGDRERCLEAGMNDYLSKPINLTELLTMIARHLAPFKDSE